jgi:hypothetical protein
VRLAKEKEETLFGLFVVVLDEVLHPQNANGFHRHPNEATVAPQVSDRQRLKDG